MKELIEKIIKSNPPKEASEKILSLFGIFNVSDSVNCLKIKLESNAVKIAQDLLKDGKPIKEDANCQTAFLMLAHLKEIEDYVNSLP